MSDSEVHLKLSPEEIRDRVYRVVDDLLGKTDELGVGRAVKSRIVHEALGDVESDYRQKSLGTVGQDGRLWPALSKKTIKERMQKLSGLTGQPGFVGLTDKQKSEALARRRQIYLEELRRLLAAGVRPGEARRQASLIAKAATQSIVAGVRAGGGKGTPGIGGSDGAFLPILIDSGRLLDSASQGQLSGKGASTEYQVTTAQQSGDQEIIIDKESVAAHSGVFYGDSHMRDTPIQGGIRPARPWKYDAESVPADWLSRWAEAGAETLAECITDVLRNG